MTLLFHFFLKFEYVLSGQWGYSPDPRRNPVPPDRSRCRQRFHWEARPHVRCSIYLKRNIERVMCNTSWRRIAERVVTSWIRIAKPVMTHCKMWYRHGDVLNNVKWRDEVMTSLPFRQLRPSLHTARDEVTTFIPVRSETQTVNTIL